MKHPVGPYLHLARKAAGLCRKHFRQIDFDDAFQTATRAMLEAFKHYNAAQGPLEAYLWRAAKYATTREAYAMIPPVSGGSHRPATTVGKTYCVEVPNEYEEEAQPVLLREDPVLDERIDEARWKHAVRARVTHIESENTLFLGAAAVLLEEKTAEEQAAFYALTPRVVYLHRRYLRAAVKSDPVIRTLSKDLHE